ncbi:hypothetical protein LSPH24S_09276 [Lysinibacillus sphaericus]
MQTFESVVEQKSEHLLVKAYHFGASDLLLIPQENRYIIYFRKYDKLLTAGELPTELAERIVSYYKFLAALDISERRKPQSGSFQINSGAKSFCFTRFHTSFCLFKRKPYYTASSSKPRISTYILKLFQMCS